MSVLFNERRKLEEKQDELDEQILACAKESKTFWTSTNLIESLPVREILTACGVQVECTAFILNTLENPFNVPIRKSKHVGEKTL